jgi:hypothetical protein
MAGAAGSGPRGTPAGKGADPVPTDGRYLSHPLQRMVALQLLLRRRTVADGPTPRAG